MWTDTITLQPGSKSDAALRKLFTAGKISLSLCSRGLASRYDIKNTKHPFHAYQFNQYFYRKSTYRLLDIQNNNI